MLGAIVGDIVGSRFEFNNHRSKDFDLFAEGCFATDDSIMTLAVAKAIMEVEKQVKWSPENRRYEDTVGELLGDCAVRYMQEIGRHYPNCGYGGCFYGWMFSDNPEPYNSFGNGAAMRVSPAGFAAHDESEAEYLAEAVTEVTHNHDEGIKGAKATAVAIYMARAGYHKGEIRDHIEKNYYPLRFRIDDIRKTYKFNETCQETVPQAIECFLESTSFEDAIRIAISLGGDSDTIGAITGAIAEAYYGVPDWIKDKALGYLDERLRAIYDEWQSASGINQETFHVLTKYIGKFSRAESFGEWIIDTENDGSHEHPIQFPFVGYSGLVRQFEDEFYEFSGANPQYKLTSYGGILEANGLKWGDEEMRRADVDALDAQCILALIMGAIRAERFCDGALLGFFKDGMVQKWLKRLKDIDWQNTSKELMDVYFDIGGFFGGYHQYHISFSGGVVCMSESDFLAGRNDGVEDTITLNITAEDYKSLHTEYWGVDYFNPAVLDGTQWNLTACYKGVRPISIFGSNRPVLKPKNMIY
jgi:ADP-ribosylglycohydrolase